ncbi:UNVERIFIED_CONTAM: hypothetical protein Scaly_2257800 [Sesamum calycinum]|uniref:Reverse transcriptase RNase H-like domain-containing protein n=1 Tax=Sesamum calycinum TaxID=2727403 RepID=A0AAW2MAJ0_9LAMI
MFDHLQVVSAYEREMSAFMEVVRKWRPYLLDHKFFIYRNQQSLRSLLMQTVQALAQHKWLSKLLGYSSLNNLDLVLSFSRNSTALLLGDTPAYAPPLVVCLPHFIGLKCALMFTNSSKVVVDRLSKHAHFVGLPSKFTVSTLVASFAVEIYRLHGMHGQIKVLNRVLETYLRYFVGEEPRFWFQFLHSAEFWYNSCPPSSFSMTPFQTLYGRSPPTISSYISGSSPIAALDDALRRYQLIHSMACYLLARVTRFFSDYSHIASYRSAVVVHRNSVTGYLPLFLFFGLGSIAYALNLPLRSRVHPIFHASLFKPFRGDPSSVIVIAPPETTDALVDFTPSCILGHRNINTLTGP